MFLLKSRGRKQFFVVAREALGRIWAVAGRQGRLWAFSRSYFFKVKWILNEFLPKLDRLVLGCINEFLNFFFEFVERVLLIRSFLKKNAKIRKKKEREKFEWKLQKSWFLRIFRLWEALFWQNLFEFSVFVVNVGKISSSSSQSRKKNLKIHWYGLFLAGRSWQNFDATPYCNS